MVTNRWKDLSKLLEMCEYTSLDRKLVKSQALQLFHAFLLQCKECEGTVFFVDNSIQGALSSYYADTFLFDLKVTSHSICPAQNDYVFPLSMLMKKNDLLIILASDQGSPSILGAAAIAREFDVPLITMSGGLDTSNLSKIGDLNLRFPTDDETLTSTAEYSFLQMIIDTWNCESLPPPKEEPMLTTLLKLQTQSPQITL